MVLNASSPSFHEALISAALMPLIICSRSVLLPARVLK